MLLYYIAVLLYYIAVLLYYIAVECEPDHAPELKCKMADLPVAGDVDADLVSTISILYSILHSILKEVLCKILHTLFTE